MQDLIIIGSGPAGLSAGVYAGRYMLNALIIGEMHGGTLTEAHKVCNFPSKIEITGLDLSIEMMKHAKENGAKILNDKVSEIWYARKNYNFLKFIFV